MTSASQRPPMCPPAMSTRSSPRRRESTTTGPCMSQSARAWVRSGGISTSAPGTSASRRPVVRRHSTDPVALLAGALFIVVGAAYLGGGLSDTKIEARWVLPTVLITLGFAGLLASLVNLARQRRAAGVTAPPDRK